MTAHSPRRLRVVRWVLFLYLFGAASYFMPGASWAPVSRFSLTRAIVERGTFEITHFAGSTGDRARVGDRYFTDKAPVPSFAAVPAYAVYFAVAKARGRFPAFKATGTLERPAAKVTVSPAFRMGLYVCSLSTAGIAAALLGLCLFEALRRRVDERIALLGAVVSVLGTPLFAYGVSFFGHTVAASLLFGAFVLHDPRGPPHGPSAKVLAGALLGLACGSEYVASVPAALLALWFASLAPRGERVRAAGLVALGAAGPLLLLGGYHAACFGSPFRTGYSFVVHPDFAPGHARGLLGVTFPTFDALYGILFGTSRGLFFVSPVALAGLIGGHFAYKRHRDPALAIGALVFVLLSIVNASYYRWDGGLSTGPRHLVPALGFVGVLVGVSLELPSWRFVTTVAAGYSCLVMVLIAAVGVEVPTDQNAVLGYLVPALERGEIARVSGASNVAIELGLSRRASLLPILTWLVSGGFVLRARASAASV